VSKSADAQISARLSFAKKGIRRISKRDAKSQTQAQEGNLMMKDEIDEFIEIYGNQFKKEMELRKVARQQEQEFADLGQAVIEKGFQDLVGKLAPNIDWKKLDKENTALSEKLAQRVAKAEKEMGKMPDSARTKAKRLMRVMQETAIPHHHSGCVPAPPLAIFEHADGPTEGSNICEVSSDLASGRIYPNINVWGTGRSGQRDSEVICDYLWSFIPDRTEGHWITPHIEMHGYSVITLEHHCFYDGYGHREFEILMDVSQTGILTAESMSGPEGLPHGRIDTWRWPNYSSAFLRAGARTWVMVRIRLQGVARSKYSRSSMNFGDPMRENFIGMPWLCWMGYSEF
jgi:hypothetical protein